MRPTSLYALSNQMRTMSPRRALGMFISLSRSSSFLLLPAVSSRLVQFSSFYSISEISQILSSIPSNLSRDVLRRLVNSLSNEVKKTLSHLPINNNCNRDIAVPLVRIARCLALYHIDGHPRLFNRKKERHDDDDDLNRLFSYRILCAILSRGAWTSASLGSGMVICLASSGWSCRGVDGRDSQPLHRSAQRVLELSVHAPRLIVGALQSIVDSSAGARRR